MKNKFFDFIDKYRDTVSRLEKKKHVAYFNAAVTGKKRYYNLYARLEIDHARFLRADGSYGFLDGLQKPGALDDVLLKRQAKILHHIYKAHQLPGDLQEAIIHLETQVANKFSLFRAEVDGHRLTDNQVEDILETSTDPAAVEKAWKASKMVGGLVEADVRRLVEMRNQAARLLGYPDYHDMSLRLSELDPAKVIALFDQLDKLTAKGFGRVKDRVDKFLADKFGIDISDLRPWHYQNRFFQEAPKINTLDLDKYYADKDLVTLTARYFEGIGMPVDDLIKNSDLFEKPGKNQHAFCIHIDRCGDVRVLCNIKPNRKWMNTMLHEYGHAVYEKYYANDLPFILREPAHIFTTEAVAMFFGRLASDPHWMSAMGIIRPGEAAVITPLATENMQTEQLLFSRWAQVMYRFEQSMYADPRQDLNQLWWSLVNKYQGLAPPDDLSYPHWASKIHVATAPCYYHNYLLGELLASQLYACIEKQLPVRPEQQGGGYVGSPVIGKFFREKVFAPGARYHWSEMIRQATGSELNPEFYVRQFAV